MKPPATHNIARAAVGAAALLALLTTAAGGQQGAGQSDLPEEEEEIRHYSVELIIFENTEGGGAEIFLPDAPQDPFVDDIYAAGDDPLSQADFLGADIGPGLQEPAAEVLQELPTYERAGLVVLGPQDYVLDDLYARLKRLDAYRPLMRAAWVQPTIEKDQTLPIKLRRLGNPPLRLDGSVTLYLSRFLHLVVDLSLEEKSPVRPSADRYFGDSRSNTRFGLDPAYITPSVFYRIQEDRIVRNGELRYFDHPKFGVLAKITRIEEEQPEVMDDTADLLPGNVN